MKQSERLQLKLTKIEGAKEEKFQDHIRRFEQDYTIENLKDEIDRGHEEDGYMEGADSVHNSCDEDCSSEGKGDGQHSNGDSDSDSQNYPVFEKRMTMREPKQANGPDPRDEDEDEKLLDQATEDRRANNIKRQLGEAGSDIDATDDFER